MKTTLPTLIAIDLDGTLIDSVADLHQAVAKMQGAMGKTASSQAAVRNWVGNGIERLVHRALTDSMEGNAAEEEFAQGLQLFQSGYRNINGQYSSVYPAVEETLRWLVKQGIALACVTNKARSFTLDLLDAHKLAAYFGHVVAGDDVSAKKPDPEALLTAAKRFSASPSRCLMIGDSVSDVKAAEAAGFGFIGVSYGYNHGQSLHELVTPHNHIAIIDSFEELKSLLQCE